MIYRTGLLLKKYNVERYIQVETILAYYNQQYINTGKHMLYEDESFIGNIVVSGETCSFSGFIDFEQYEKDDIENFLKGLIIPVQQDLPSAFGFGLQLNTQLTYCEVILNGGLYEIWIDGVSIAVLTQNSKCNWLQVSGEIILPSVLRKITKQIENYYDQF
jgi:hypothetical protein